MTKTSSHDATDAALGFYFQALYALLVLFESLDDDSISVETGDDIQAQGSHPRLFQLKHSAGQPPALTEKNDGLWKTLDIWMSQAAPQWSYIFVTCAAIADGNPLNSLAHPKAGSSAPAVECLEVEAQRIVAAVDGAPLGTNADPGSYKARIKGCRAFLAIPAAQRQGFVDRITILARSATVSDVEAEVTKRLAAYPRNTRPLLAQRTLEWWDYRIARSLAGMAPREISKDELLNKVHEIASGLAEDNLPDDFSSLSPSTIEAELGSMMEKQISLVGGGASRIQRAAEARWRARNQRARWLKDRIGLTAVLEDFDRKLVEYWRGRHGPLRDDCSNKATTEKRSGGLQLLDWSHHAAHLEVPPPRPRWEPAFLVQGSYQQLADQLIVGWHPDFESILKGAPIPPGENTSTTTETNTSPKVE